MTDLRTAAQQALDFIVATNKSSQFWRVPGSNLNKTVTALRAALAEPVQEPVAWMYHGIRHDGTPHDRASLIWRPEYMDVMSADKGAKATPLYAAPPQRTPLSDEEIDELAMDEDGLPNSHLEFARAIERAHGIGE